MSCYHPLSAVRSRHATDADGKNYFRIIPYADEKKWNPEEWELLRVPCGKCIGCRLDYSRQWADRCMLELQYHDSAYFVTLTYDDAHVPTHWYPDPDTGDAFPSLSLDKRDLQLFLKRLRARTGQKIRFFGCGEYGTHTFRPHYHIILFGLQLDDLVPFGPSRQGYQYYTSDTITKAWSIYHHADSDNPCGTFEPLGFTLVGACTWETCAYTARYVTKKVNGPMADFYRKHNIVPEFAEMSRKPGIARQYYDEHKETLYDYKTINISTEDGGRKIYPPRYYDKLFDVDFPEQMAEIKEVRKKLAAEKVKAVAAQHTYDELQYLGVQEENKQESIKALRRDII